MKISAPEEYGLRCLLRLARVGADGSSTINEIAEAEGLSVANVRKLMMILREAGLVQSARGRAGGYTLSAPPGEITVGKVFESLSGRFYDDAFCNKHSGELTICINSNACAVRSLWNVLDGLLWGVLNRTHLSDLIGAEGPLASRLQRHVEDTVASLTIDPTIVQLASPLRPTVRFEKTNSELIEEN
jgi:Rrf2 family protein